MYRYLSRQYLDVHQVIQHVVEQIDGADTVEQIRYSATRMLQRNTTPVVLPDNSRFYRTAGSLLH